MFPKAGILISTITLIMTSFSATAMPPLSETNEYVDDFPIVGCGEFEVRTMATTRERSTYFFDKDGVPVRLRVSLHISDAIYYNSLNPEIFIQQGASGTGENFQIMVDLVTGTERYTGLPYRITIPGVGPLFVEAGHGYWDGENFTFNGISMFPEAGTGSALCDALAF